jgi:hypothetical protein
VDDEKQHDEHDDQGITVSAQKGIRLPKSVADRMAPPAVWLVYAIALWIVFHGLANAIAIVRKSL